MTSFNGFGLSVHVCLRSAEFLVSFNDLAPAPSLRRIIVFGFIAPFSVPMGRLSFYSHGDSYTRIVL